MELSRDVSDDGFTATPFVADFFQVSKLAIAPFNVVVSPRFGTFTWLAVHNEHVSFSRVFVSIHACFLAAGVFKKPFND